MNTDRSIKELLTLFNVRNISELGSDIIMEFFNDISVKEAMNLCRINKQFNEVCKREFTWRNKISYDYGIAKKYGDTWKETAKLLYNSNMINLRQKWIDGRTYGELFDEALESNDDEFFRKVITKHGVDHVDASVYSEFVEDLKSAEVDLFRRYPNYTYDDFDEYGIVLHENEDELQRNLKVMTREFSVIGHAFAEIRGSDVESTDEYGLACLGRQSKYTAGLGNSELQNAKNIRLLVDPILYVMTYSLMSLNDLNRIYIW